MLRHSTYMDTVLLKEAKGSTVDTEAWGGDKVAAMELDKLSIRLEDYLWDFWEIDIRKYVLYTLKLLWVNFKD